jgi:hypothetical protein
VEGESQIPHCVSQLRVPSREDHHPLVAVRTSANSSVRPSLFCHCPARIGKQCQFHLKTPLPILSRARFEERASRPRYRGRYPLRGERNRSEVGRGRRDQRFWSLRPPNRRTGKVLASEDVKNKIREIGINKCARESGFDRKNFIRKLVRDIPVKRNSYNTFVAWINGYRLTTDPCTRWMGPKRIRRAASNAKDSQRRSVRLERSRVTEKKRPQT